jgi:hypothetical protein
MRSSSRRRRGTISSSFTTTSRRDPDLLERVHIPSGSCLIASVSRPSPSAAGVETIFALARVVGFARRVTIAFHISDGTVTIDRVLYGGRELSTAFREGR